MPIVDVNICPVCQRQNKQDVTTCAFCGEPLKSVITVIVPDKPMGKTDQEHLDYLRHQHYDGLVLFVAGQKQPIVIKNLKRIVLGRQTEATPATPMLDMEPYGAHALGVSRQHAMIKSSENNRYSIEDLSSTNGTFVNENRLQPLSPQVLFNGDMLRLGQLILFAYYKTIGEQAKVSQQRIVLISNPLLPEVTSPSGLTVSRLHKHLTPFLEALAELQYGIDVIQGRLVVETSVISMSHNATQIIVELSGATDAIHVLREVILPWRQKYGIPSLKDLPRAELSTENDTGVSAEHTRIMSPDDSDDITIASEDLAAQTRKIMEYFQDELIPVVMTQIGGDLTAAEEDTYRARLSPHLRVLSVSPLELSLD